MFYSFITIALLGSAGLIEGGVMGMSRGRLSSSLEKRQSQTCLNPEVIQDASDLTGQEDGTEGIEDGQAPSAT